MLYILHKQHLVQRAASHLSGMQGNRFNFKVVFSFGKIIRNLEKQFLLPYTGNEADTVPDSFTHANSFADIHFSPDKKFLYFSNRGHNSLAFFGFRLIRRK
ncbi:MAG: lactonase family protein [Bacteroidetes bacterium]|nr:lactonase family protein [Bacteroidota bacterium]